MTRLSFDSERVVLLLAQMVVDAVQQGLHDLHVDTTWSGKVRALMVTPAILCALSCTRVPERSETSLMLERSGCLGTCPVYRVSVSSAGVMRWEGTRFVAKEGRDSVSVDTAQARRLVDEFRRMRGTYLPRYLPVITCVASYTDASWTRIVLFEGSDSVVVARYDGCQYRPGSFYRLVGRFERTLEQRGWLRPRDEPGAVSPGT